jgi:hypothetical protein
VTAVDLITDDPLLTISRPAPFWRSPYLGLFVVSLCVMGAGVIWAGVSEPPPPVVTVKGIMASKQDFFNDKKVQELLLAHNIKVDVTARGSSEVAREVINQETDTYDFAFPSGQPAADLIKNERSGNKKYHRATPLFTSPIVLASFRDYAEALVGEGAVTAQPTTSKEPLHYTLETARFLQLGEAGRTWTEITSSSGEKQIKNGNRVLVHTPGVCRANSAATYLGLIAFVKNNGQPPQNETQTDLVGQQLQPLITGTGMPESDLFRTYISPEGKSRGPVVVVYEHQYLAYQLDRLARTGEPDIERVLLYPREESLTDPEFIALKQGPADQLAELLATDPALRNRMKELGYRVFDDTDTVGTEQLFQHLYKHGLQVPRRDELTRALLPNLDLLERLIDTAAGGCRR